MPETTSPLRYPGAKRFLANYIDSLLNANNLYGATFYEPYAGSAAVGIELLQRGHIKKLVLCEKDILLYSFWDCVFRHTEALNCKIESTPITIETWKQLQPYRDFTSLDQANIVELGFSGLFFNRTNFSGILNANPIGGINQTSKYKIDCRFNKTRIIELIKNLSKYKESVEVHFGDALDFMRLQESRFIKETCFAYFDPPYYEKGSQIYRHYYTNQDHICLAKYVSEHHHLDWIISYDDAPFICALYGDIRADVRPLFLDYSCAPKIRSKGQELLISNLRLPPFKIRAAECL